MAQPGESQGRPLTTAGSKPIAVPACPKLVSRQEPLSRSAQATPVRRSPVAPFHSRYDSLGQLTGSQVSKPEPDSATLIPTSYEYDPAGHLTAITADGTETSFAIDALGRQASQTIDDGQTSTTTELAYLGTSNTVSSTVVSNALSAYSAIDAIGDRVTTGLSGGFAYLVPDLHGNVVAAASAGSSPGFLSAYRYDAYGETVDSWVAGSGSVAVPYRYQGRRLQNAQDGTDLYDFGARSYDPDLGSFTSFDTVAGSAQNPLTLNRYLYASANPATMVDPDGHSAQAADAYACSHGYGSAAYCGSSSVGYVTDPAAMAAEMRQIERDKANAAAQRRKLIALNDAFRDPEIPQVHHCNDLFSCAGDFAGGFGQGLVNTPGRYINAASGALNCVADTFSKGCLTVQGVVSGLSESMNPNAILANDVESTVVPLSQGDFYGAGNHWGERAGDAAVTAATIWLGGNIPIPKGFGSVGSTLRDTLSYVKANGPGQLSDWIRFGRTRVSNQILVGPEATGFQWRNAIKMGGKNLNTGYELPFHGHIGLYNLLTPSLWFVQTPILW
jgi:RHS repeat-associated protein